jgi:hypothetical protein
VATVLVDARNVLRSQWPNLPEKELVDLARAWGERHGHELVLVFDGTAPGHTTGEQRLDDHIVLVGSGAKSADEWLIREAPRYDDAWLVTSDRALREAAGAHAARLIGGGSFLRDLDD